MKYLIVCLIVVCCVLLHLIPVQANPGDTVVVKTFTFDSIHTRRAVFQFPEMQSWEKILMYYTIKCDAATPWDQYPCGEWDYTTYTNVYEHTGLLDSVQYSHPRYTLNNYPFDVFYASLQPRYHRYEKSFNQNTYNYSNLISYQIGEAGATINTGLHATNSNAKMLFLYPNNVLINNGVNACNITGLGLHTNSDNTFRFPVEVRLANTGINSLTINNIQTIEYSTVFDGEIEYDGVGGIIYVSFQNTFEYDGLSGIVVELSFPNNTNTIDFAAFADTYVGSMFTADSDNYIGFENYSYVDIPSSAMPTTANEISICLWVYGNPEMQAQNDMLLEAYDSNGRRQLCVHYPWGNGSIYWDAGNTSNSYDRIEKAATANEYEGRWNHLAFTKNTATGSMKIYINGQLWHSGTGKTKPITDIETFILGCAATKNAAYSYDGFIDDFSVWNKELSLDEIQAMMFNKPNSSFEAWNNLLLYYDFDEEPGSGVSILDISGNQQHAEFWGSLNRMSYRGQGRFKNFSFDNKMPVIEWHTGEYTLSTETCSYIDSVLINQQILREFENINDYSVGLLNTSVFYPNYDLFTHSDNSTDTLYAAADFSFENSNLIYFGAPYEIVNTIQIQNYVTPYGINLNLGSDGFTHVYDVSDYVTYLHGMVDIQSHNTQELLDLTFVFIEGTPPRNVVQFDQVYLGNYGQYNLVNNISLPPKKVLKHADAQMFTLKARTTGHGMEGAGNCAEFCPTWHHISVDGEQVYEWYNWKKCASNPIFPQGGTWIFDRAGWCPGSFADTHDCDISPWVANVDSIELDYGMTQHPVGNGEGNFNVSLQLIQYSEPNFQNDAAIVDVIAPSNADIYKRYNPVCKHPEIVIKNTGANTLQWLNIEYGLNGDYSYNYQWQGSLEFLELDTVQLPVIQWNEFIAENTFNVRISAPNTVDDEYLPNNHFVTHFNTVDIYTIPNILVVRTNNYGSETHYQVLDSEGNVLVDRDNLAANTTYNDTLDFDPGCYEIRLYDRGEDGLRFWYWQGADGTGYMKLRKLGAGFVKNFPTDFGSFIYYQFVIADDTYIQAHDRNKNDFEIFPNPGNGVFSIRLDFEPQQAVELILTDMSGRILRQNNFDAATFDLNLNDIHSGFYLVHIRCGKISKSKKLIIERD